jgi:hypothetical protein
MVCQTLYTKQIVKLLKEKQMHKMNELYELTKKFNTISGAINETSETSLIEQYTYIREEFKEMADTFGDDVYYDSSQLSLETRMITPLLDDCLDVLITVFGMLQKLETLGVDISGAAIATAMNNLSKYPTAPTAAHETVERKAREGVEVLANFNEEFGVYTLRNAETGKVVKPYNFISNDLSVFVPKDLAAIYKRQEFERSKKKFEAN